MKLDFRDVVFSAIHEHMRSDAMSVLLTNDMGAMGMDAIRAEFPGRCVNVGIAEQNMMSVAAGLALSGFRVFVYGIVAHVFSRAFEQFRNDICVQNLPVAVAAVGSGLAYGSDGPTHHGVQDIAVLRSLPNLTLFNPADGVAARRLMTLAAQLPGPSYLRMDKEQMEPLYAPDAPFDRGFSELRKGGDGILFATGVLSYRARDAAEMLERQGRNIRVVDVYRLKPLDRAALAAMIAEVPVVATLEENVPIGGLSSLVAEVMAEAGLSRRFVPMTLGDEAFMGAASRAWAEKRFGLDLQSIVARLNIAMAPPVPHGGQ